MIKVFLSDKYPNYFYIQYSGEITPEEDDSINDTLLIPFLAKTKNIYLVMEYLPSTVIIDKTFFDSTGLHRYDPNREISTMISFGLVGIQKSFIRKYYKKTTYKEMDFHILDTRDEFQNKFNINFENDFKEVYSFQSK